MERLTKKRDRQNVIPLKQNGETKWAICSAGMGDAPTEYLYGEHADRLAAYEDTGLEPEEVNVIAGLASENCAKVADKIDQLLSDDKELEQAKREQSRIPEGYALVKLELLEELDNFRDLGPIDRLRELKKADDEGRCVVLPFKPPRWVYVCSTRFPKPAQAHYASAINVLQDMEKGCVFGDTPEEAEAALRRELE